MIFDAREGVARFVEKIFMDGRDVTDRCWSINTEEGWADLYPGDPTADSLCGDLLPLRAWSRKIEVVWIDTEKEAEKVREAVTEEAVEACSQAHKRGMIVGYQDGYLQGLLESNDLILQAARAPEEAN